MTSDADGGMKREPGEIEQPFGSTTWQWRRVKVQRRPEGSITARRSRTARLWRTLPRGDRHKWVTVRIRWRGGAESWWLVEARGKVQAVQGWQALEDLMCAIHNEDNGDPR